MFELVLNFAFLNFDLSLVIYNGTRQLGYRRKPIWMNTQPLQNVQASDKLKDFLNEVLSSSTCLDSWA